MSIATITCGSTVDLDTGEVSATLASTTGDDRDYQSVLFRSFDEMVAARDLLVQRCDQAEAALVAAGLRLTPGR